MPLLHRESGLVARTFSSVVSLEPEMRPPSAAQVLASMLDLNASVKLAHCLSDPITAPRSNAPLLLGDYVRKRLEAIHDVTGKRLGRPFDPGRASVPDKVEAHALLLESKAWTSKEAATSYAESLARYLRSFFHINVGRVRAEMAALREEITEDMRKLGSKAARLEAIDAIVRASIEDVMPRWIERAEHALDNAFVPQMAEEAMKLDTKAGVNAVAPWFAETGPIGLYIARTRDVVRSLLTHEAAVVEALVDAACLDGFDVETGVAE